MSLGKNYNNIGDIQVISDDGLTSITLEKSQTSSKISLTQNPLTSPVNVDFTPSNLTAGGNSTPWNKLALLQTALSAVDLPDNPEELKVISDVYLQSTTDSNLILDKSVNTITQYYTATPPSDYDTRLTKQTDKNLELAVLNNNINIKKNITPPTIADLTANRNIITDALSLTGTQATNSHIAVVQSNQKMIYGDNTTSKIINIQNFADALFFTVNLSTLGLTLSGTVSAIFANSVIYMIKTHSYTSQTNMSFTVFLTNATNTILFMAKCIGDPTLAGSYTVSTSYLNVGNSVDPLLTSTANGSAITLVSITTANSVGFTPLNINFYDDINDLYIFQSVNNVKTNFNYLVSNFNCTQACYYPNYNLGALTTTHTYNVGISYTNCLACNMFSSNTTTGNYRCQFVYWNKTTQSLHQSQLILLNTTIANLYNRQTNANLDTASLIVGNMAYFYIPIFIENTPNVNYDIRLLCLKQDTTNMISTEPTIEFNRLIVASVATTTTNINNKPYSIRIFDYNKIEVYSTLASIMRTSNDAFATFTSYSYSAFTNLNNVNIGAWVEMKQATIITGQTSKFFHDVLHILLFSVNPSSTYTRLNYIYLTAPSPTTTALGSINFTSNNIDLTANNKLILESTNNDVEIKCNSVGTGGNIILTGGTNLLSGSSGGSSGQHLRLTINGTVYKIALLNN